MLLELGRKGSLHRLEPKTPKNQSENPELAADSKQAESDSRIGSKTESESRNWGAQAIDIGTFTRLISLAQSCGMVPNVDNIANARDADFRAGQYLTALYNIERMYTALNTAAQKRQQQLKREETSYRSGGLRMSPKDWNLKLARDRTKTQAIDRALNQFRKVMAGLRLRALDAQQFGGQRDSAAEDRQPDTPMPH
jgi:hypothetical protein